jgi:spermidine synthase
MTNPGNLTILAYEHTPLGPLCLRRRELLSAPGTVVTEVTLAHEFLMSSHITVSERALADSGLTMHDGVDLRVFVGGLGLGYTTEAVLAHERVARVEVVEFLPQVLGWLDDELFPVAPTLKRDARFQAVHGDVYAMLTGPPDGSYDVILVDVDHAPDDRLSDADSGFYTARGLEKARAHLAPGGVLGVWSYAESSPFSEALRAVFDVVEVERVTYHNDLIDDEITDWLFFAR